MKNSMRKTYFKRGLTGALAALMIGAAFAPAVTAQRGGDAPAPVEGRQFGSKAGGMVNDALTLINSNQFGAAVSKLNETLALELNPYERSTIYQMMGSAYYEQDNYGQAISSFENAINAGGLLPNESTNLRLNIAQLLIASGRNREGAQMMENYINQGNTVKDSYIDMLVGAWVGAEDYRRALPWAEKWFNNANPKERKHFDLLNFLYNTLGMTGKQADIVKEMIVRFPTDKTLWDTWISMLANGGREEDAFEVTKMQYLGGSLSSENDLLRVVQYYSAYEMPYQAAGILEREMNAGKIQKSEINLIQLAERLLEAREYERATPVLEEAARISGKAKIYAQLGEALHSRRQCDAAETALKTAVDKGYNRGKAYSLIADCRYEQSQSSPRIKCDWSNDQKENAERTKLRQMALDNYKKVPANTKEGRDAKNWMTFIRGEVTQLEDRCIFEAGVEKDLCFADIKGAYANQVFNQGVFQLQDASCQSFVEEYDSIYRQKVTDEG